MAVIKYFSKSFWPHNWNLKFVWIKCSCYRQVTIFQVTQQRSCCDLIQALFVMCEHTHFASLELWAHISFVKWVSGMMTKGWPHCFPLLCDPLPGSFNVMCSSSSHQMFRNMSDPHHSKRISRIKLRWNNFQVMGLRIRSLARHGPVNLNHMRCIEFSQKFAQCSKYCILPWWLRQK